MPFHNVFVFQPKGLETILLVLLTFEHRQLGHLADPGCRQKPAEILQ